MSSRHPARVKNTDGGFREYGNRKGAAALQRHIDSALFWDRSGETRHKERRARIRLFLQSATDWIVVRSVGRFAGRSGGRKWGKRPKKKIKRRRDAKRGGGQTHMSADWRKEIMRIGREGKKEEERDANSRWQRPAACAIHAFYYYMTRPLFRRLYESFFVSL